MGYGRRSAGNVGCGVRFVGDGLRPGWAEAGPKQFRARRPALTFPHPYCRLPLPVTSLHPSRPQSLPRSRTFYPHLSTVPLRLQHADLIKLSDADLEALCGTSLALALINPGAVGGGEWVERDGGKVTTAGARGERAEGCSRAVKALQPWGCGGQGPRPRRSQGCCQPWPWRPASLASACGGVLSRRCLGPAPTAAPLALPARRPLPRRLPTCSPAPAACSSPPGPRVRRTPSARPPRRSTRGWCRRSMWGREGEGRAGEGRGGRSGEAG